MRTKVMAAPKPIPNPEMTESTATPDGIHLKLEMLSQPRYLSGARELVAAVAKRLGFSERACGQIALAIDEALCNIMCHGYGSDPKGVIWLSIEPLGGHAPDNGATGIRVVIEDEATQIDPDRIKSRNLDDIRPGGLGVHIIHEVMDSVCFQKRETKGMRLSLEKNIDTDENADTSGVSTGGDCGNER